MFVCGNASSPSPPVVESRPVNLTPRADIQCSRPSETLHGMPTFPESAPEPNSSACPRLTWRARPSTPPSAVALRLHSSWPLTVLITRCEFGRVRYPLQRAKISRVQSLDPALIRPARNVRYVSAPNSCRCRGSEPQSQVRRDIWSRSRSEPASRRSVFDVRRPVSGECVQGSTDSHALRLPQPRNFMGNCRRDVNRCGPVAAHCHNIATARDLQSTRSSRVSMSRQLCFPLK